MPELQFKSAALAEHHRLRHTPAPRPPPPGTEESYNPPPEYLEDGQTAAKSLRTIKPATRQYLTERYNRQVDLFEAVRRYTRDQFDGTSEQFLQQQLKAVAKLKLRPYPTFCDIIIRAHIGRVNSVDISPNGRFLVSGGRDGLLRIFELRTGKLLRQVVLIRHARLGDTLDKYYGNEINCVKFCPNDRVCIIAAAVGTQLVLVNAKLSMGHNLQETLRNTQTLLNPDVQRVRPCRGWKWECLQGTAENLGGEQEDRVVHNARDEEEGNEENLQQDVDDPRFD